MSLHWLILLAIILIGNFLGLGSMLIGFANSPAVLISGADIKFRGTARYTFGTIAALLFQSIAAITLSALVISYTRYITSDKENIFIWIVGTVGAIYPMWQTWSLARMERLTEPESYVVKEATHKAVPYSFIITAVVTLFFVFQPSILDNLYYWLLALATLVGVSSVISIVLLARQRLSNGTGKPNVEELKLELEQSEKDLSTIPEVGRDIAWIDVLRHVFRVLEFDRAGTIIGKGNSVKATSKFSPYGYLLVESPIFSQPIRLPITHKDDFLLAASVFDEPQLVDMITQEEMLVTYVPKQHLPTGHALGFSHVLHYVIVPYGTLDDYYEIDDGTHMVTSNPEQLFGGFIYEGEIKVQVNSEPEV